MTSEMMMKMRGRRERGERRERKRQGEGEKDCQTRNCAFALNLHHFYFLGTFLVPAKIIHFRKQLLEACS